MDEPLLRGGVREDCGLELDEAEDVERRVEVAKRVTLIAATAEGLVNWSRNLGDTVSLAQRADRRVYSLQGSRCSDIDLKHRISVVTVETWTSTVRAGLPIHTLKLLTFFRTHVTHHAPLTILQNIPAPSPGRSSRSIRKALSIRSVKFPRCRGSKADTITQ